MIEREEDHSQGVRGNVGPAPAVASVPVCIRLPPLGSVITPEMLLEDFPAGAAVIHAPDREELPEAKAPFALAGESGHRRGLTQVPCLLRGALGPKGDQKFGWIERSRSVKMSRSMEQTPGSTVLVVEDDADVREVLCEILERDGRRPVAVRDGREALRELRSGLRPCLIVLDMLMPGMDGWQFRRNQQADETLAKIPVIVVSGVRATRNSALQGGAVAFLPKPVVPEALLSAVASAC
jgi:CheY-like chemotaxis protein